MANHHLVRCNNLFYEIHCNFIDFNLWNQMTLTNWTSFYSYQALYMYFQLSTTELRLVVLKVLWCWASMVGLMITINSCLVPTFLILALIALKFWIRFWCLWSKEDGQSIVSFIMKVKFVLHVDVGTSINSLYNEAEACLKFLWIYLDKVWMTLRTYICSWRIRSLLLH